MHGLFSLWIVYDVIAILSLWCLHLQMKDMKGVQDLFLDTYSSGRVTILPIILLPWMFPLKMWNYYYHDLLCAELKLSLEFTVWKFQNCVQDAIFVNRRMLFFFVSIKSGENTVGVPFFCIDLILPCTYHLSVNYLNVFLIFSALLRVYLSGDTSKGQCREKA